VRADSSMLINWPLDSGTKPAATHQGSLAIPITVGYRLHVER
jgi:hypothetical protein